MSSQNRVCKVGVSFFFLSPVQKCIVLSPPWCYWLWHGRQAWWWVIGECCKLGAQRGSVTCGASCIVYSQHELFC